jgi:dihydrofolate reductase
MGKIVSNFFISMDGVVERPDQWHFPYFDEEMGKVVGAGMETAGAFLMGHRLYDEWSQYWPQQTPDQPFATFINEVPKYVLASQDFEPTWQNTTVISGDEATVTERVRALKDDVDGDIQMSGCATTSRWLMKQGLLDELGLLVHPIAVAKGQRLFEDTGTVPLELIENRALPTGVLLVRYAPKEGAPAVDAESAPGS